MDFQKKLALIGQEYNSLMLLSSKTDILFGMPLSPFFIKSKANIMLTLNQLRLRKSLDIEDNGKMDDLLADIRNFFRKYVKRLIELSQYELFLRGLTCSQELTSKIKIIINLYTQLENNRNVLDEAIFVFPDGDKAEEALKEHKISYNYISSAVQELIDIPSFIFAWHPKEIETYASKMPILTLIKTAFIVQDYCGGDSELYKYISSRVTSLIHQSSPPNNNDIFSIYAAVVNTIIDDSITHAKSLHNNLCMALYDLIKFKDAEDFTRVFFDLAENNEASHYDSISFYEFISNIKNDIKFLKKVLSRREGYLLEEIKTGLDEMSPLNNPIILTRSLCIAAINKIASDDASPCVLIEDYFLRVRGRVSKIHSVLEVSTSVMTAACKQTAVNTTKSRGTAALSLFAALPEVEKEKAGKVESTSPGPRS